MFVALTLSSPSHSHSHSTNRANYRNNLFCIIWISGRVCFSLSLSISLNRLQVHTQNNTKKKQKKQTLYSTLFWTLTQSYDDFVLPHLRERDARRRGGREGEGGVLILMLSCLHARSRSCFRSLARTHSLSRSRLARDKCFVSGQIKIEASGDGTYYLIAHVHCTHLYLTSHTCMHICVCISTLICCALDMETDWPLIPSNRQCQGDWLASVVYTWMIN